MDSRLLDLNESQVELEALILGAEIHGFRCGDFWSARLYKSTLPHDLVLVFQGLNSSKVSLLTDAINLTDDSVLRKPDPEEVVWAALLAAALRRKIIGVSIAKDASLKFVFEGGIDIVFSTDTEIVDWQWSIGSVDASPYDPATGSQIACFWKGEITKFKNQEN